MKRLFIGTFLLAFIFTIFTNSAKATEVELNCDPNGDWGLVYLDQSNQLHSTLKQYHGTPSHPDLRLGLRDNKQFKSYFLFDISSVPSNATITAIKIKASYQDLNISNPANMVSIQGIDQLTGASNLYSSLLGEYSGFLATATDHEETWNDPAQDLIIQQFQSRNSSSLYPYFGIRLELGDMSVTDDFYETKMLQMWVTYEIPPEVYDITVINSFDGGYVKVGDVGQPGTPFPSGTSFPWEKDSQHDLTAYDQDYPNPNNFYRQFKDDWHKDGTSTSSSNPLSITITADAIYEAQFKTRYDFELDNNYSGFGGGGSINYNGTSTNMPYSNVIWDDGSYTLEAITPVTKSVNGTNVTYNFVGWSNGNYANSINLQPNSHTDLKAIFKGHKVAFDTDATGQNNSRNVIKDPVDNGIGNKWHMVYEDGGQVYYTRYSNVTNSWVNEKLLSNPANPNDIHKNPNLAYYTETVKGEAYPKTIIGISWEIDDGDASRKVAGKIYDTYLDTWSETYYNVSST